MLCLHQAWFPLASAAQGGADYEVEPVAGRGNDGQGGEQGQVGHSDDGAAGRATFLLKTELVIACRAAVGRGVFMPEDFADRQFAPVTVADGLEDIGVTAMRAVRQRVFKQLVERDMLVREGSITQGARQVDKSKLWGQTVPVITGIALNA